MQKVCDIDLEYKIPNIAQPMNKYDDGKEVKLCNDNSIKVKRESPTLTMHPPTRRQSQSLTGHMHTQSPSQASSILLTLDLDQHGYVSVPCDKLHHMPENGELTQCNPLNHVTLLNNQLFGGVKLVGTDHTVDAARAILKDHFMIARNSGMGGCLWKAICQGTSYQEKSWDTLKTRSFKLGMNAGRYSA